MTSKQRQEYLPIYSPCQKDVLKLSVAFRTSPQEQQTTKQTRTDKATQRPNIEQQSEKEKQRAQNSKLQQVEEFLTPRYDRMEKYLRGKHFPIESKEEWTDKTEEEKVLIAYYLTCEYLSECDYHYQEMLFFERLFFTTNEASTKVRNGFRFPYIFPYTLSILEKVLGDGSVALDFVYETYGTKFRASTNLVGDLNDVANVKNAASTLFTRNKDYTSDSIWRFAAFSKTDSTHGKLIIGYGCNFCATDSTDTPLYPAIDACELRKSMSKDSNPPQAGTHSSTQQSSASAKSYIRRNPNLSILGAAVPTPSPASSHDPALTLTAVTSENDLSAESSTVEPVEDLTMKDPRDGEDKSMEDEKGNLSEDPNWNVDPYRDSYTVLGHTLPAPLQPITVVVGENRFQTYSVLLRHPLGEDGQKEPASKLASDMCLYLNSSSELGQFSNMHTYHVALHSANVQKWSTLVSQNCKQLQADGNVCRMEVAIPIKDFSSIENIENEIKDGIDKTWKYCRENVKVYCATDAAEIANFFAKALTFRVNLAKLITQKNRSDISPEDMAVFNVLSETNAYIKHFYSGRKSSGDFNISGKHLGKKHKRPILKPISSGLSDTLKKVGIEDLDVLWTKFLATMGIALSDEFKCFQPSLTEYRPANITRKLICPHCMRIIDEDKAAVAHEHPCKPDANGLNIPGKGVTLLEFTSPFIQSNIHERREKLSLAQKQVVNEVLKSRDGEDYQHNVLITGVAGSGKSTTAGVLLLEILKRAKGMGVASVISPTKNAAGVLYGETVNKFFSFGVGEGEDYCQNQNFMDAYLDKWKHELSKNSSFSDRIKNLDVLFIDECSLLTALGLQNIDRMLQLIRDSLKPFGGVQIILIGDPLQLPPVYDDKKARVSKPEENELWDSDWRFFFQSPAFCLGHFRVYSLTESHRQKGDPEFIRVLNRVRDGTILDPEHLEKDLKYINSWGENVEKAVVKAVFAATKEFHIDSGKASSGQVFTDKSRFNKEFADLEAHFSHLNLEEESIDMTKSFVICAENLEATTISASLDVKTSIGQSVYTIPAQDRWSNPEGDSNRYVLNASMKREVDKLTKRETSLKLYRGKMVKFASNRINDFIANNMLGQVTEIITDPHDEAVVTHVKVRPIPHDSTLEAKEVIVTPMEETFYFGIPKAEGKMKQVQKFSPLDARSWERRELVRKQFPLCSANAGTIYIFQGTTCPADAKIIVCPQYIQHTGSVYTALSRVRNKEQLLLLFPLVAADIKVDPVARSFDLYHRPKDGSKGLEISEVDYYYCGQDRVTRPELAA